MSIPLVKINLNTGGNVPQIETRPIMDTVKKWWFAGVDLIFPSRCAGCGQMGIVLCEHCQRSMSLITHPLCHTCGKPTVRPVRECESCIDYPRGFQVRAFARYEGPIVRAILHLKYRPNRELAKIMAAWLYDLMSPSHRHSTLIIPVPLGKKRLRARGYNQASLIAKELSRYSSIPFNEECLVRTRETMSQVGLDPLARQRNVEGAFKGEIESVNKQAVVLVDDLVTTGATLSECARALMQTGAQSVVGLSIARA